MKRIYILLSLAMCVISAKAQQGDDYRPFIEEGKVWLSYQCSNYQPVVGLFWRYDYFDGDTIVGGKECKHWIQKYVRQSTGETFTSSVAAYEENRQVWFFYEGETTPHLYFDFGASPMATFDVTPPFAFMRQSLTEYVYVKMSPEEFDDYYTQETVITKIEDDFEGGKLQRKYYFFNGDGFDIYYYPYLLEGIGGVTSPDWNLCFFARLPISDLIYCVKNGEVLYFNEEMAKQQNAPLPNAVTNLPFEKSKNISFFDLSGRRLSARPAKGLYIEDGKVKGR